MKRLLIQAGQLTPDTTLLRKHFEYWEDYLPFDGLVIPVNSKTYAGRYGSFIPDKNFKEWSLPEAVFHNRQINCIDYKHATEDLNATIFKRFKHNFLPISFYKGVGVKDDALYFDWTDSSWWKTVLHNIKVLAQIAYEGGCEGLFFDTEQYGSDCTFEYKRLATKGNVNNLLKVLKCSYQTRND